MVATLLGLLRVIPLGRRVTTQLPTHRAVMNTNSSGDLSLAHACTPVSVNLVSLGLGQLSVCHALLHFGR